VTYRVLYEYTICVRSCDWIRNLWWNRFFFRFFPFLFLFDTDSFTHFGCNPHSSITSSVSAPWPVPPVYTRRDNPWLQINQRIWFSLQKMLRFHAARDLNLRPTLRNIFWLSYQQDVHGRMHFGETEQNFHGRTW